MKNTDVTGRGRRATQALETAAARGAGVLLVGAGLGAWVSACGTQDSPSYMRPSGAPADAEATLGWWLTGTAIVVVVAVTIVLLIGIFRRRGDAGADGRARPSAARALVVDDHGATASGQPQATAGAPGDTRPQGGDTGLPWIYYGTAATVLVLLIAFVGTGATLRAASRPPTTPTLTLDVTGHMWWWEAQYHDSVAEHGFTTANELHIPAGRPVRVRLSTADVIHSFWIPELAGKTDLIPGQHNEMWLQADRPGRYRGQCAEYCGMEHAKMALYVVADAPADYERWAAGQRQSAPALVAAAMRSPATGLASPPVGESMPATAPSPSREPGATGANVQAFGGPVPDPSPLVAPTTASTVVNGIRGDSLARAGQSVFLSNCGACHAVRGSDALGRVGPDLTHVASRATIASGIMANTTGNLSGWVANAQGIKPGSRMPTLPLPPNDLLAVVHYLQTLR